MGYRIEYQPVKKVRNAEKRISRIPALTALFLLLFFLLVSSFWPRGRELMRELIIPGDPDVTVAALEVFAQELHGGEELSSAFESFCRRILTGESYDSG